MNIDICSGSLLRCIRTNRPPCGNILGVKCSPKLLMPGICWILRHTIKRKSFSLLQTCSCLLINECYITSTLVHSLKCLELVQEIFFVEVGERVSWLNVCVWHHVKQQAQVCTSTHKRKGQAYIWQLYKTCNYYHPANYVSTNGIPVHHSGT